MENMGEKRRRKVKGGRSDAESAAKAVAAASEGGQNLPNRYEGSADSNPSNYVLISVGLDLGAEKNGGYGWSSDGGGGGGRKLQH